ncbi:hypothetical protein Peur_028268 [Populus x canadensis]
MEFCSSFFLNCCTWPNGFSLFIPCLQLVDNKWFDANVLLLSIITWFLSCMWSLAQLREASCFATYTFLWARSDLERNFMNIYQEILCIIAFSLLLFFPRILPSAGRQTHMGPAPGRT